MTDKIIEIVRKAIESLKTRRDVVAGYGIDRKLHRSRNNNIYDQSEAKKRYWFTSTPTSSIREEDGVDVIMYRNMPLANAIQTHNPGDEFDFVLRGQMNHVGCLWHHHLRMLYHIDIINNYIEYPEIKYPFDTLEKYLKYLEQESRKIEENESQKQKLKEEQRRAKSEEERNIIEREIKKIEEENKALQEYKEQINNLTRYIHTHVQLRFKPVVDPVQTRIKSSHLFDNVAVVIDGGPGTGKTTTMISRLKYLTDTIAIEQDAELGLNKFLLTPDKRRTLLDLIEHDRDWVFFSPSGLLQQYLAHAMENERLSRPSSKVYYWTERLDKLMQEYGLFDPTKDNPPFKNAKRKMENEPLIQNTGEAITQWENYFVSTFKNKRANLPSLEHIKSDDIKLKQLASSLRNQMEGIDKKSLNELIDLFVQLSRRAEECKPYLDERKNKLDTLAKFIVAKIRLDEEKRQALLNLILKKEEINQDDIDEEIDIDDEEEQEDEELDASSENEKIFRFVHRWIEPYARSVFNKYKLSEAQQSATNIIAPILNEGNKSTLERIANLYVFYKYADCTKGVAKILYASIPTKYKSFRKSILKEPVNGWNIDLLNVLVESDRNTRLHRQEQALLIGFINTLAVKILRKTSAAQNRYIDCYKEFCRPIIGIDEATDFSDVDVYAMCSFAHKDFSAITLSGDLMQRLTKTGLASWDELQFVLPKYEVIPLEISYRQSTKMLDVARELYQDTIGELPVYKAFMDEEKVPDAIAYISDSLQDKINWLEERIKEIYKAYGKSMPSVAIFLKDEDRVAKFTRLLKETDFFEDNGFPILEGNNDNLGSDAQVRVFPISKVKGLEFDVVFFIDIDENMASTNIDLMKRYLYVGVSRAAFFLGVTLTHDDPELTKYFQVGSIWQNITQ